MNMMLDRLEGIVLDNFENLVKDDMLYLLGNN